MVSFSSALDSAIIKVILITHYFEYSTYLEPYNSSYFLEEELQAVHEYWRSMNRYSKQVLNKEKVA